MPLADTFQRQITPLYARYAESPLSAWLRQAGAAVLSLLPTAWRQRLSAGPMQLGLQLDADGLSLLALRDERETLLGQLPLDAPELPAMLERKLRSDSPDLARWLLLPADRVLRRRLSLPLAAEPRLQEVLANELDRQTPFSADQVCFAGRVLARDVATRQLQAELVVLPKAQLEATRAALGALGTDLAGVDVRDRDGRRLGINLLPAALRPRQLDRSLRLQLLLAMVGLIGLLAALQLVLHNRQAGLTALQQQVDTSEKSARDVRRLRNELSRSLAAAQFIAKARAQRPAMLDLLQDLTRRIPDNTSLEKLSVNEGRVVLVGQSQQAPALVGLLQPSPLLQSPALAGAVQTDPRTGRDRFTLTATVAGSGKEEGRGQPNP